MQPETVADTEIPTEDETKKALALAHAVYDEILSHLPESIRP